MDPIKSNPDVKQMDQNLMKKKDEDLKKACKDFESIFTYQLLKTMRQTVQKCDLFHGGQGEEIYESLFDMELSKRVAGSGRNSLSELLYSQLKNKVTPGEDQR